MSTPTLSQSGLWDVTQVVTMDPFRPGAFGAILLRDGRKVATVENGGRGRNNHYVWLADRRAQRKADQRALEQAAQHALPAVTRQVADHYVARLLELAGERHRRR